MRRSADHIVCVLIWLNWLWWCRYEDRQAVARERRALEKIKGVSCAAQLHRVYAEQHQAFLVFE